MADWLAKFAALCGLLSDISLMKAAF